MEQEPGSSGVTAIEHAASLLSGYMFEGEKATGPIEVRAGPFIAGCEAGRIKMVKAKWNQSVIDELNGFPDGENDDQIVALALAYNKLIKGLYGGVTWGRDPTKRSNVIPIRSKSRTNKESGEFITGATW